MPHDDVPSPCIQVCTIHPRTGLCTGCQRTLAEIAIWSQLSNPARQAIIDDLRRRQSDD